VNLDEADGVGSIDAFGAFEAKLPQPQDKKSVGQHGPQGDGLILAVLAMPVLRTTKQCSC
jgi:hypothetical protein